MKILILAGGKATRLGFLSKNTAKSMIDINGKPFLSYILNNLEKHNFDEVKLCLGHLSHDVVEYIKNKYTGKVKVVFSFDGKNPLGTGGAIKHALKNEDQNEPFFVMYGDSYLRVDYAKIYARYLESKNPLMTIFKNENFFDKSNVCDCFGSFRYSKNKPCKKARYIDYGLSIFSKENLDSFPESFDLSLAQEKFSNEKQLSYFLVKKRFYEIGSFAGIEEFKKYIVSNDQLE